MPVMPPSVAPGPAAGVASGATPTVPTGHWRTLPVLRVFGDWGLDLSLRIAATVALVLAVAWVVGNARPWATDPMVFIADTSNYYAAGERLNVGHSLYAYGPDDRHVLALLFGLPSPYLYPPLMGVLWRPVAALLPFEPVVIAFWAAGMASLLGFLVWLLWRGGRATAAGCLILLVPLAITAWSGNVSTFIAIAIVGAWLLLQRGHDRAAGAIIGFTTVLKAVGLASLAVSVAGAGVAAHVEFLHVGDAAARGGGIQGSIVGILSTIGTPADVLPLVAPIVSVAGLVSVWALRRHERAAWAVAIATGVFASPIFNLTNVTVLLAAFVAFDGRLTGSDEPRPAPAGP